METICWVEACMRFQDHKKAAGISLFLSLASLTCHGECGLSFPETVSVGSLVTFESVCHAQNDTSRIWEFGDTEKRIEGGPTATHRYSDPGRYIVFVRFPNTRRLPKSGVITVTKSVYTQRSPKSSTIVVHPGTGSVWNVNRDNESITKTVLEPFSKTNYSICKGPTSLAAYRGEIWVVCEHGDAVVVLNENSGKELLELPLPRAGLPYGIVIDENKQKAYVSMQALGTVLEIDVNSRVIRRTIEVGPWPRAMALSHTGNRLWVTRFISPRDRGELYRIDLVDGTTTTVPLDPQTDPRLDNAVNGRGVPNGLSSVLVAQDGERVFTSGKKDNTFGGLSRDGKPLTFEHTVRSLLCTIGRIDASEDLSDRIDIDNRSLPTALETSLAGDFLFVATAGTNHVTILDANLAPAGAIERSSGQPVLAGDSLVSRLAPVGLALDRKDSLLFVHFLTSRDIGVYDVSKLRDHSIPTLIRTIRAVSLEEELFSEGELLGKQLFYNAQDERMAAEGYISCAVCHLDGGSDGRVYDFSDRGEGLRKTISLFGRAGMQHGPLHFSANFDEIQDFENDIRGAFGGSGFLTEDQWARTRQPLGPSKRLLSAELDALAEYVASLDKYRPSPYRTKTGALTESALRGQSIFFSPQSGCTECHSGQHFTNSSLEAGLVLHDVGTLSDSSGSRLGTKLDGLDVQTLNGLWESSPYLHDGSAKTLREVLVSEDHRDRHGRTSHLGESDITDLVHFLRQLDGTPLEPSLAGPEIASGRASSKLCAIPSQFFNLCVHVNGRIREPENRRIIELNATLPKQNLEEKR